MNDVLNDLNRFFKAVDQAFAEVLSRFAKEVACKKGCDDCCHAVFDLSLVEAINLQEYLGGLGAEVKDNLVEAAQKSLADFAVIRKNDDDLAYVRIRCPLLGEDGACVAYAARPVNCRTYGIPTVINGTGHVCGLSNFAAGISYPTVNLEQLQKVLYGFSLKLADEKLAAQRWPVAAVILQDPELEKIKG